MFDYGAGNLHSLGKALAVPGVDVVIETDPRAALDTDMLVLPGVGNFTVAAGRIAPARDEMRNAIMNGLPTLGVCLGMQLLFDESEEGPGKGLGVIAGRVTKLNAERIPQIGWNSVEASAGDALFSAAPLTTVYYANSFACRPIDGSTVTAWTTHERDRFPAAVRLGSAVGVQFHPEKSSTAGVRFVRRIVEQAILSSGVDR
ncbi:MAG: imidazole glycerol phosphate synthase subunit HisH [Gemmatimonadaceae bacterium]